LASLMKDCANHARGDTAIRVVTDRCLGSKNAVHFWSDVSKIHQPIAKRATVDGRGRAPVERGRFPGIIVPRFSKASR